MSAYELGGWDAVFREPVDDNRVRTVVRLLGRDDRPWRWASPLALKMADVGQDAIGDALQAFGRDEPDQAARVCQPLRLNLAWNGANVDQAINGLTQVIVIELLKLVRQQDDQHVFVRGQCAGDPGVEFHSCCAPPSMAGVVPLAPVMAHRNRSAIFRSASGNSRTAFAIADDLAEAFYQFFFRVGDAVAAFGARISRRVA